MPAPMKTVAAYCRRSVGTASKVRAASRSEIGASSAAAIAASRSSVAPRTGSGSRRPNKAIAHAAAPATMNAACQLPVTVKTLPAKAGPMIAPL